MQKKAFFSRRKHHSPSLKKVHLVHLYIATLEYDVIVQLSSVLI